MEEMPILDTAVLAAFGNTPVILADARVIVSHLESGEPLAVTADGETIAARLSEQYASRVGKHTWYVNVKNDDTNGAGRGRWTLHAATSADVENVEPLKVSDAWEMLKSAGAAAIVSTNASKSAGKSTSSGKSRGKSTSTEQVTEQATAPDMDAIVAAAVAAALKAHGVTAEQAPAPAATTAGKSTSTRSTRSKSTSSGKSTSTRGKSTSTRGKSAESENVDSLLAGI